MDIISCGNAFKVKLMIPKNNITLFGLERYCRQN